MKLAVITDSSAFLQAETLRKEDLFVLDIPVNIDGQEYVEGVNLTAQEFYEKMARSSELPKTSQPSIAKLDEILSSLKKKVILMFWVSSFLLESQDFTRISNI